MSRQARLVLVLGVMGVVAVVALAMVARQYTRVRPLRSVAEVEGRAVRTPTFVDPPAPVAASPPQTPAVEEGADPPVVATGEEDPGPARAPEPSEIPEEYRAAFRAFVAGREAVAAFAEDHPHAAADLIDEAKGFARGEREQVKMHLSRMLEIRVRRGAAIQAAGLDEDGYRRVLEQFRAWSAGEGDVDPTWAMVFESDPEGVERADIGDMDLLDT